MGPAWLLRMEKQIGSIEQGKLADLVMLDRDLFKTAPYEIHQAVPLMTVMNGRITHDRLA